MPRGHAPHSGAPAPERPSPNHLAGQRRASKTARRPAGTHPPQRLQPIPPSRGSNTWGTRQGT
eukprot:10076392-Lingulodinium_polyedra.AAC.1